MVDEMQAGREMDKIIGDALGAEPKQSWEVMNTDETASAFSARTQREVEKFLPEHLERYPDTWLKDYHVGYWNHYNSYSTDISAAWKIIEKMQDMGFTWMMGESTYEGKIAMDIVRAGREIHLDADTAPLAICRAALRALEVSPDAAQEP